MLVNEPRAYREVLAETIRELRPEVEVLEAEPEAEPLESSVSSFAPDMMVCTRGNKAVHGVPVWVELYPDYGSTSVVSVSGRRREVEGIELQQLLALVDEADGIAQHG